MTAFDASSELCPLQRGKHGKQIRQSALMEAATRVFAEKGYDAATTREIAGRAGCSEGLIHRYFGGKRGLLLTALRGKCDTAAGTIRDGVPDSDDLRDEVQRLALWWLDYTWEARDFMRVSVGRSVVDPEVGHFIGSVLNRQRVAAIEEKLRRHQRAGRVRPDVDVAAVAEGLAVLTFAAGFFSQVVFEDDRHAVRRRAVHIADIIARGIAPPPTPGVTP